MPSILPRSGRLRWPAMLAGALLGAFLLLGAAATNAAEIALVLSRQEAVYQEFATALRNALPSGSPHRLTDAGSANLGLDQNAIARADLVIAVGAAAAEAVVATPGRPVLAVMVARQSVDTLRTRQPRALLSGMVLDQPLERQMRLVRAAMPRARRVAVLLGPQSAAQRSEVVAAANAAGLEADVEEIRDRSGLLPALERLLTNGDALLALPDPVVFNVDSARPVLLTAYRYRRPMIGYSRAYVNAGSLAAVYSSPADVARQVAEWLATQARDRIELPPVQAPRYYSVAVNTQVARNLGLDLVDEQTLTDAIADGPRR